MKSDLQKYIVNITLNSGRLNAFFPKFSNELGMFTFTLSVQYCIGGSEGLEIEKRKNHINSSNKFTELTTFRVGVGKEPKLI